MGRPQSIKQPPLPNRPTSHPPTHPTHPPTLPPPLSYPGLDVAEGVELCGGLVHVREVGLGRLLAQARGDHRWQQRQRGAGARRVVRDGGRVADLCARAYVHEFMCA